MASTAVTSYLDLMGFDVEAYEPATHAMDGRAPVSRADAREPRLEHAERLADEVRRGSRSAATDVSLVPPGDRSRCPR
ncbi:hypothetical protein GCM10009066_13960 [Halarchaeum salinum]|uniref:Uncharacterized protein n=1 Tax=Halarchaeum salinum TaxID=489912 RepID=A0AAV3S8I2_9EURY